jgi:mannose-6-phosphate isomerase-like protein (cupin superfamily)
MTIPAKSFVIELDNKPDYQRLLDGQPQTRGMRSGRVFLTPGKACGQHSTKNHEEVLVFLSGHGELQIEQEQRFIVGEGKVAYIPPNTVHDVSNSGSEPLIYIYCVTPVAER